MNTELLAFLDESRKPVRDPKTRKTDPTHAFYVVAGAVVFRGNLDETRTKLREIVDELGFPLHYFDIGRSPQRQIAAAERLADLDTWDGYVYETPKQRVTKHAPDARLRAKTLQTAIPHLVVHEGITELVLETRSMPGHSQPVHDNADHQTLNKIKDRVGLPDGITMRHETKDEPLLWIADIIASARTDLLCGKNSEPYNRLAHRIRAVTQATGT